MNQKISKIEVGGQDGKYWVVVGDTLKSYTSLSNLTAWAAAATVMTVRYYSINLPLSDINEFTSEMEKAINKWG